jgi:hypothetical protein
MDADQKPDSGKRTVARREQIIRALDLRAMGATYDQIGKSFEPPVSRQRAFKIVQKALAEYNKHESESAENVRSLVLRGMNKVGTQIWRHAKQVKLPNGQTDPVLELPDCMALLKYYEQLMKAFGLHAPQKVELTGAAGAPLEVKLEHDFSKLTLEQKLQLEELLYVMQPESEGNPS